MPRRAPSKAASEPADGSHLRGADVATRPVGGSHRRVGVTALPSGRYRARINNRNLGTFDTAEDAALAYDEAKAATEAVGETTCGANLNVSNQRSKAEGDGTTPLATPKQAARRPLPPSRDPSPTRPPRRPWRGRWRGWAWQALPALLILVAALVVAPPSGMPRHGGPLAAHVSSSSPSPAESLPSCAAAASDEDVHALVPPRWYDTVSLFMDTVREAVGGGDTVGSARALSTGIRKAPVLMLVAGDAGEARTCARLVRDTFGDCHVAECILTLDCRVAAGAAAGAGSEEQDTRGALQQTLTQFLRVCPKGVVVIDGAEALSRQLLSALLPALSEGGRYMRDGTHVRADLATYVVTVALGRTRSERWLEGSERTFARHAKDALAEVYEGGGGEDDDGVVGAFRRRVDFVAPFNGRIRGIEYP